MIDFSTVKGITVPEGVVKKIESNGVVLWERISDTVILQVEKITSDTYANSTTYTGEQFILLGIYPKTNGTVNVTYGGLTKTITDTSGAAEPSAQQVFFGTFNGVSDSVETPASGTLTISGDYRGFGVSSYNKQKAGTDYCDCITQVCDWGVTSILPDSAFEECSNFTSITIPNNIISIGKRAFHNCTNLTSIIIPESVTYIGNSAFKYCDKLTSVNIPYGVTSINEDTFFRCTSLTSIIIPESVTTIHCGAFYLLEGETRTVTMTSETPPVLIDNNGSIKWFDVVGTNHIIVPAGCGAAYKTAEYWSEYADYITEASA